MIICIGPVCIPLWGLLPFLVSIAHGRGYLQWFRQEWVSYRFWKKKIYNALGWEIKKKKTVKTTEDSAITEDDKSK
ncbi:hypothetical protein CYMTET_55248 [Cymbomonas tetramitiformis]|uniref:Uncharacterized protein n=1 Tax=Cymbomonas tetramitiformis TaxID=36881 RepID=A0AAE0BF50_9CHLO|nr:hypothetical protein CYMTET_55248 [Cymbomonas tetramitiformis]